MFSFALVLLALLVLPGCGTSPVPAGPEPVAVDGTVTMDGQPLVGASVMFGGGAAMGETDASGHYELAGGGRKGVPPGDYQVVVEKWVTADGSVYKNEEGISPMDAGAKQEIPAKYSNMESTELKATVPAGGGTINFDLKSK